MSLSIDKYIADFSGIFAAQKDMLPWHIIQNLAGVLLEMIRFLDAD